jgi:hypothetical protein
MDTAHIITITRRPYTIESDTVDSWQVFQDIPDDIAEHGPEADAYIARERLEFDPRWDDNPVAWAVNELRDAGTTEDHGHWFGDPDPDSTMNPYSGEYEERSAQLEGFTEAELEAIGACLTDLPYSMLPAGTYGMAAAEPLTTD